MRPTPNTKTFLALLAMTVSTASAQDEYVAKLEDGSCEWNTFMCCWTSGEGMTSASDVCRVLDYPYEGDVVEMPRDSEGPVDCHGFGWGDDADVDSEILPLFYHLYDDVKYGGGYSGNVEGAPECGCVEEMPVVDDAECIRIALDGSIIPCNHGLRGYYRWDLDEPNGEMEMNLVNECDNTDVPDYDYSTCENNVYMCCWSEREGGLVKNTDVCRIGDTEYPGGEEGEIHCHGVVWPEDADDKFIHLLTQNMQNYDHKDQRGYSGTLPNAPMCACIEQMPEVSRADCTEYNEGGGEGNRFRSCVDLRTKFENEYPGRELNNLVEQCDNKDG